MEQVRRTNPVTQVENSIGIQFPDQHAQSTAPGDERDRGVSNFLSPAIEAKGGRQNRYYSKISSDLPNFVKEMTNNDYDFERYRKEKNDRLELQSSRLPLSKRRDDSSNNRDTNDKMKTANSLPRDDLTMEKSGRRTTVFDIENMDDPNRSKYNKSQTSNSTVSKSRNQDVVINKSNVSQVSDGRSRNTKAFNTEPRVAFKRSKTPDPPIQPYMYIQQEGVPDYVSGHSFGCQCDLEPPVMQEVLLSKGGGIESLQQDPYETQPQYYKTLFDPETQSRLPIKLAENEKEAKSQVEKAI